MVKKMLFLKSYIKDIIKNKKRFLSLSLIVGIVLGVFLCFTSLLGNIKNSYQAYLKKNNLYDLKISTSYLFSKDDKSSIKSLDNIEGVKLVKTLDVISEVNGNSYNVKLNSISNDRNLNSKDYINHLTLTKGRYPRTINEGLIEESFFHDKNLSLNDLIILKPNDENFLRAKKIKIVGTIKSSYYNLKRKEENKDNKKLDYYLYLDEKDFNTDYYNECFIKSSNIKKLDMDFVNNFIKEDLNKRSENEIKSLESEINSIKEELNSFYTANLPSNNLNYELKNLSEKLTYNEKKLESIKSLEFDIQKRTNDESFDSYENELNILNNLKNILNKSFVLLSIFCFSIIYLVIKNTNYLKEYEHDKNKLLFKYILYSSGIIIIGSLISIIFSKITFILIGDYFKKNYDFILINKLNINYFISKIFIFYLLNIIFILVIYIFKNLIKIKEKLINIYIICLLVVPFITLIQIKTSILDLPNKQFNSIFKYDMIINFKKDISNKEKKIIYNKIKNNKNISKYTTVYKENINVIKNKLNTKSDIVIFKNEKDSNNFIKYKVSDKVAISKNLAKKLNIDKNDNIKLVINNKKITVKVDYVTKNYIGNYIYINSNLYKKLTNDSINYSSILTINKKDDASVIKDLENHDGIYNIELKSNNKTKYKNMLSLVNTIFIILIIYIFIINFIIIYNLANINVNKRKNEIANLKLLGLYDSYIVNTIFKFNKNNLFMSLIFSLSLSTLFSFVILNLFKNNIFYYKLAIISFKYLYILPILIILLFIYKLMLYLNIKKITNK